MPIFRIIITESEFRTILTIDLPRSPDIGEELNLENGNRVVVQQVTSSEVPEYAAVILAAALAPD